MSVTLMNYISVKWRVLVAPSVLLLLLLYLWYSYGRTPPCGTDYLTDSSFQHLFGYCNSPHRKQVHQEGIVPAAYKLESVHVVIRHGDRKNIHGIHNYDEIQVSCRMLENPALVSRLPVLTEYQRYMQSQKTRRKDQTFADWDVFPDKDACETAALTPTGAAQHVVNGLMMKNRYIENLGLLNVNDKHLYKQVLVRSTGWTRTFQSALALMYGLLGDKLTVDRLHMQQVDTCTLCLDAASALPCDCAFTRTSIDTMSATHRQLYPEVMSQRRTQRLTHHYAKVFGISNSDVPRISTLMDFNMVHVCNGVHLPGTTSDKTKASPHPQECVEPWAVRDTYDVIQGNGETQSRSAVYQKSSRLKFMPLLTEIKDRMLQQAKLETEVKFVLYSGHDTTINPLALALNFSEGHWPSYASKIVLELYSTVSDSKSSRELFVRVLFNGRVVTTEMEFCKRLIHTAGVSYETGLCPFEVFQSYVERKILEDISEVSYKSACDKVE